MALTEWEQAASYHARERTRSFRNPAIDLDKSRSFISGAGTIDVPAEITDHGLQGLPATFETEIQITGLAASGLVFEFGDAVTGIKVCLDSDTFSIVAGDAAGNAGVDISDIAIGKLGLIGSILHLVIAVNPGKRQLRFWIDGKLRGRADSVAAMTNGWTGTGDGSVGEAAEGAMVSRGTPDITTAPSDFTVSPLNVYWKQLPKQMNESLAQ